jgi:Domain of unknown function (DUF4157)
MRATVHQNTAPKQSNGTNSVSWNKPEVESDLECNEALHLSKPFPKPCVAGSADDKPTPPIPISFDFSKLPIFPPQQARIQPKLKINAPGDRYEQEADRVAEQVMRMPEPQVQRKLLWGASTQPNPFAIQRKCDACAKDEEETLQAKSTGNIGGMVAPGIAQQIQSSRGGGQSMDAGTRTFMEARFGTDFGGVRIHNDNNAALFNQRLQARAFTFGQDIYFNQGQYIPGAGDGRRLLAHELTHVVQQSGGTRSIQRDDTPADKAVADEAKKKADLVVKIKAYGITAVEDADAAFTSVELDLVDKALAGLPATDKAAIKGAKIIRVQSLGATTAAQYSNSQGFSGTTPNDEQKIELSNRVFGTATSAAESIRLITHEVGHAVAAMPHRVAMSEVVKEGVKSNRLIEEANVAVGEFNAANDESNAAIEESNAAVDAYNAAIRGTDKAATSAAKKEMDTKKAATDKLRAVTASKETTFKTKKAASEAQNTVLAAKETAAQAKIANIDDLKTDAATKLTAMQTAYTAAAATIGNTDAESADYRAALTATDAAIKKFYDENVALDVEESAAKAAKSVVDAAIGDRDRKREALNTANPKNTVVPALTALEAAQDSCFRAATVVAFNRSMNLSVRKFYDFVTSNRIPTTLTAYASNNWPHKPEEFYAEAYSFFVTKPTDLETYSKPLFDWFKTGKYK